MATLQNNTSDVKYINDLISANNPVSLIAALKSEGIIVPPGTTEIILSNLMDSIFNNEKDKWVRIVKATRYNPNANNWTTTPEVIATLGQTFGVDPTAKIDFGGILTNIGDFFGGSSTTVGGKTVTTNTISAGLAAAVTLIIVAVIGVIIWKS